MASRTLTTLRNGLWCIALGAVAAIVALRVSPSAGLWLPAGAAVAAALLVSLLSSRADRNIATVAAAQSDQMLALLPPLAREVLERLPDPLMLLDSAGRVIFANKAMVAVVGTDTQRKHVSAVLRTPTVLQAIDKTAASGEPAAIDFSFRSSRIRQMTPARTGTQAATETVCIRASLSRLWILAAAKQSRWCEILY